MRNFQFVSTFDPFPLVHQIQQNPSLWDQNKLRTTHELTPHKEVSDIWIRFNDLSKYLETGENAAIIDEHESIWYPGSEVLWTVKPIIFGLMAKVSGVRLGRALITKVKPGGKIYPHVDGGSHAAYYQRYHCVLQGLPGSLFRAGTEEFAMLTGQIWWFDNAVEHEVTNNSVDDRIHLIVDIAT